MSQPIDQSHLHARMLRAGALLEEKHAEAVVATSSANVFYFTEKWINPHERVLAVVLRKDGRHVVLAPEMHRRDFDDCLMDTLFWHDGEDSLSQLASLLPSRGTVAIDNLCPSQQLLELMRHKPGVKFVGSDDTLGALRCIKDATEAMWLRRAGAASCRVMEQLYKAVQVGNTERHLVETLNALWREEALDGPAFEPIVAVGANAASPHHETDDTKLRAGEFVVIDMGGLLHHYCADMTRTVALQAPSDEMVEVYEVVRAAQQAGMAAVRPGVSFEDIDGATRNVIVRAGYGDHFIHRTGHGLGIDIHEAPYVCTGNGALVEANMVFSIEPGIYLPGKFGVRIEDSVIVTEDGCESLNPLRKELIVLNS